jgi:hypothetical protein
MVKGKFCGGPEELARADDPYSNGYGPVQPTLYSAVSESCKFIPRAKTTYTILYGHVVIHGGFRSVGGERQKNMCLGHGLLRHRTPALVVLGSLSISCLLSCSLSCDLLSTFRRSDHLRYIHFATTFGNENRDRADNSLVHVRAQAVVVQFHHVHRVLHDDQRKQLDSIL